MTFGNPTDELVVLLRFCSWHLPHVIIGLAIWIGTYLHKAHRLVLICDICFLYGMNSICEVLYAWCFSFLFSYVNKYCVNFLLLFSIFPFSIHHIMSVFLFDILLEFFFLVFLFFHMSPWCVLFSFFLAQGFVFGKITLIYLFYGWKMFYKWA